METTYTPEITKLFSQVDFIILSLNETIKDAKEKLENAFLYNFEWNYPEILYKALYEKEMLAKFLRFAKDQPDFTQEWLEYNISRITKDLLQGNYVGQSTSVYSNMAVTYKKEVECKLLRYYKNLLSIVKE